MAAAPDTSPASDSVVAAYGEFLNHLRLRQAKVCAVLCIVLVPLCGGLDLIVYPDFFARFMLARLVHDSILVPLLLVLCTPWARRHVRVLDDLWAVPPAVAIAWMVYCTDGVISPYYAGLNLVIIGGCLIVPYTLREAIVFCAFVVACYVAACAMHRLLPTANRSFADGGRIMVNNLYFLCLTAVICSTACHYSAARRFHEFCLRHELDVNNTQLDLKNTQLDAKNTELDTKNTQLDVKNTELDTKNTELAATVKKLQETEVQLVQSEKMNALGKLSAGLLHEVNNPLNFTFMALQIAEQEAGDNASLKETLADIHQGMSRIRGVVADLRAFAYPSRLNDAQSFNLDETLGTAMRLTSQEMGETKIAFAGLGDEPVLGSKTQIVHVFMNLLVNAAQAMKGKPSGRPPQIAISCENAGARRRVVVRDNGPGVKPEDLPRLLEPFFTTKAPGEGTGLGLSICHTIIQNHGGNLTITSEYGHGTEVAFDLARAAAPAEGGGTSQAAPADAATPAQAATAPAAFTGLAA